MYQSMVQRCSRWQYVSEDKAIALAAKDDDNELRRQREMAKSNWEVQKENFKNNNSIHKTS